MNLQQLQQAAHHQRDLEVRVIRHGGSQLYQIECQAHDGESRLIRRRGKPQLFRSLEAVYDELRHIGIRQAYLVQHAVNGEAVGYGAHYHHALTPSVPLSF